jgi:superfamily II DNA helicase RecQ
MSREEMVVGRTFKNEVFKAGEIMFGTFYPKRYMVSAFETIQQVAQAAATLKDAGFEDVRQWIPPQVLERHAQFLRQRSAVQRVEGELSSDEEEALNDCLALAKEGHHFVTVYVPDEADVKRVQSILESNGAKATHYYGGWKLTNLSINETNS